MIRSFIATQRGSVMPLVAFTTILLIGAAGTAVDMARMQIVQTRMQNALDAAGLAGGATVHTTDLNTVVTQYFYSNFPTNYMGTTITNLTASLNTDTNVLNLSASGVMNTIFIRILGIDTVNVGVTSQITRQVNGTELVLVMDNTGSMAQPAGGSVTKLQAAKNATQALLDNLYGAASDTAPNLWVGVVPFSQAVNIGTSHSSWLDGSTPNFGPIANTSTQTCTPFPDASVTYAAGPACWYGLPAPPERYAGPFGMGNWQGCVEARVSGGADVTDDSPVTTPFAPYYYPPDGHNSWYHQDYPQDCIGGSACLDWQPMSATCTNSPPACICAANDESCVNPPGCGGAATTYACTNWYCDSYGPYTPYSCTRRNYTTTEYDYSYSSSIGSNQGPNLYCPQPIQSMVAEKSTILNTINNMQPVGETEIDLGLAWAYRMLSPKWQGLWGGEMDANSLPKAYHTAASNKVVVLMTDGDNNLVGGNYSAYGYTSSNQLGVTECSGSDCTSGINELNNRTIEVCNSMKANGIVIYTIALGTEVSTNGQNLLQACATGPSYYFLSPTTDTLETIFQKIGDSLANLRVSH